MENIQKYPYTYVSADNPFMAAAEKYALENSLDKEMPTGSVIVDSNGLTIGRGANGSNHHELFGCERKRQHIPTGEQYELCEGCDPKNHSELRAIADADNDELDTFGADLYLWGHFWCCEPCTRAMREAGIANVYLLEGSDILFDKTKEGSIRK